MLGMEQMYKMALDPRIFPDSRLLAVLQGKDNSLPMAVAMSAKQQRDKLEQAKMGQQAQMGAKQPSVRDQMLAKDLPQAGLDQLPAENMQAMGEPGMAAGGIVAFGMGGFTDPEEDDITDQEELDSLMARQGDLGSLGAGIMAVSNPSAAPYSSIGMQDTGVGTPKGNVQGLLNHIIYKESRGRDYDEKGRPLTSSKGAKFAMQVLDSTAKKPGFGIKPASDTSPEEYNRVGRELVGALHEKYKNPKLAAMAYNWGTGNVDKWLHKGADEKALPKETRMYVAGLAEGGAVGFAGGGLNSLLSEYGPEATTMDDAATSSKKPLSKEAAEFLRKQAARSAATTPAATAAEGTVGMRGLRALSPIISKPGGVVGIGGSYLSNAATKTMMDPTMEANRQALMDDPMLGAMSGDTALASAILQQNAPAIAQARQNATPATPATAPAANTGTQNSMSYEDAKNLEDKSGGPTRDQNASSLLTKPDAGQDMLTKYLAGLEQSRKQAPGLALMAAGLGIAGQRSPYGLSNIGVGGLQGLQSYEQAQRGNQAGEIAALSAQAAMDRNKVYQQHYATAAQQAQEAKYASMFSNLDKLAEDRIKNMTKFGNFNLNDPAQRQKAIDAIKNKMLYDNPGLRKYYLENTGMSEKDLYNMANPSLLSDTPTGTVRKPT